ncbi:MAG: lysophospholipid acyltransferase family protein [Eubacteriales bacterium]|nr:lysophospholipid acyltransferase family protein [Eubacteriales bacterium]
MAKSPYDKLKEKQSQESLKELSKELRQEGFHLNRRLIKYKWVETEKITTRFGLALRKLLTPPIIALVTKFKGRNTHRSFGQKLERKKQYIFCSTHSFTDDVMAAFSVLGRNAYLVLGSSQTLELNPESKLLQLNGLIFVDLMKPESRKQVVPKAVKILSMGGNILIFPEGCWNLQESGTIAEIFNGAYFMAKASGAEIVPIGSYRDPESGEIYVERGNPLALGEIEDTQEARAVLREALASLRWNCMLRAGGIRKRSDLKARDRILYFCRFRNDVLSLPWIRDSWAEELSYYQSKDSRAKREVSSSLAKVELSRKNAFMAKELLDYRREDKDSEIYELINLLVESWQMNPEELSDYINEVYGFRIDAAELCPELKKK